MLRSPGMISDVVTPALWKPPEPKDLALCPPALPLAHHCGRLEFCLPVRDPTRLVHPQTIHKLPVEGLFPACTIRYMEKSSGQRALLFGFL